MPVRKPVASPKTCSSLNRCTSTTQKCFNDYVTESSLEPTHRFIQVTEQNSHRDSGSIHYWQQLLRGFWLLPLRPARTFRPSDECILWPSRYMGCTQVYRDVSVNKLSPLTYIHIQVYIHISHRCRALSRRQRAPVQGVDQ